MHYQTTNKSGLRVTSGIKGQNKTTDMNPASFKNCNCVDHDNLQVLEVSTGQSSSISISNMVSVEFALQS